MSDGAKPEFTSALEALQWHAARMRKWWVAVEAELRRFRDGE
jgi:hypothetical protein